MTLLTYAEAEVMITKRTEELRDCLRRAENALADANNKVTHLNKSVRINNQKLRHLGK